jgi:hypothetical protein
MIEPSGRSIQWQTSMQDPFRDILLPAKEDFPCRVQNCAEPLRGIPAFDPDRMNRLAGDLTLPRQSVFPHPMLERVVRIGLAHIDATFQGNHPKYGTGIYAHNCHDGFPPVIISAIDALTLWGLIPRAQELFEYWLHAFVYSDGQIGYRGTSLSERGMLLTTAFRLMKRGGSLDWLKRNIQKLDLLVAYLRPLIHSAGPDQLLFGVPEDDERNSPAVYFHNNAWVIRGLEDWSALLREYAIDQDGAQEIQKETKNLRHLLIREIEQTWPKNQQDWWLCPIPSNTPCQTGSGPARIVDTRLGSYTNYRYWPELLSSGVLPDSLMHRIVWARLNGGGQFCGMTRFDDHLDDWPLAEWLEGLWNLGMTEDFLLSLWGHIYYHQAEGHLTAYEQVTFPPGTQYKEAAYCLPCQLVAVRAARHLVR